MAKRFTDTNKWRKDFVRGLQGAYKLLWLYILDECDHAGIWHVELDVASLRIGYELDAVKTLEAFGEHIVVFDKGNKWFIPDFIDFQYGTLNPENRVHASIIEQLEKYKLKGLISSLQRAKDKDKDKVKEVDKEEEESFEVFWKLYDKKEDRSKCETRWRNITKTEREACIKSVTSYVNATPDKQFRKNPSTYLYNKSWDNEIITPVVKSEPALISYKELCDMSANGDSTVWEQYEPVTKGDKRTLWRRK